MLGHGAIAEFAIASVRGGGVQNVGSPFISGLSFAASLGDETVTAGATISQSGTVASTFSIGTETVTAKLMLHTNNCWTNYYRIRRRNTFW